MVGDIPKEKKQDAYEAIRSEIEKDRVSYEGANPLKSMAAEGGGALAVGLPRVLAALATKGLIGAATVGGVEGLIYGAGTGGEGYEKGEEIALGVEAPIDISGRVVEGAKMATIAAPASVVGARVIKGVTDKVSSIAERNKLLREGVAAPETAGYVLRDPSSKVAPPVPMATGDIVEDALQTIPQPPQGLIENTKHFLQSTPLVGGVKTSPTAQRALYQGVSDSTVTGIREANTPTRNAMKDAANIHWAKINNKSDASAFDVVGKQFDLRAAEVRKAHLGAMKKQREAVDKQLRNIKGEDMSKIADDVGNAFTESLSKNKISLDADFNLDFTHVPKTNPLGSTASRATLNKVWQDFRKAESAADLHDLRQNIDKMVRYEKGGIRGGVDDDTAKILKSIRSQIRTSLHEASPDYADANRVISQNLDAISVLETAMPRLKKYDLNDPNDYTTAMTYMGQQLRKLDAETTNSAELSQAVDMFDNLAREYGGNYQVDIKQLSRFLAEIKLRLGHGKAAGFQAQIEAGTKRANMVLTPEKALMERAQEALNPIKGISDEQAYKAIIENIDEMNRMSK